MNFCMLVWMQCVGVVLFCLPSFHVVIGCCLTHKCGILKLCIIRSVFFKYV